MRRAQAAERWETVRGCEGKAWEAWPAGHRATDYDAYLFLSQSKNNRQHDFLQAGRARRIKQIRMQPVYNSANTAILSDLLPAISRLQLEA